MSKPGIVVWILGWVLGAELGSRPAAAQAPPEPIWNAPETLALVERALARRRVVLQDSALKDYRAHATGHVYFLFDLGPGTTRHLVKADQVALDLYWRAPRLTHQVIVGQREEKLFPTDIHYHIDHLTVVMDNFGDRIRLGEGDEVKDALHPAARGALEFYDYRVADSLTLRLPDGEVRVVALRVRPKDRSQPGIVGSLYLDRSTADIVRMDFTFTARSYLDPQLQYIHIVLENALWQRRYWLPWRQGLELRREVRWLDFPAGGVIRAQFKIGDYGFNTGLPDSLFRGRAVGVLPRREREAYGFVEGLYQGLAEDELRLEGDLRAVEAQALALAGRRYLEGVRGSPRLLVSGSSSLLRYRRAEGLYVGIGGSLDTGVWRWKATGGRAWHAQRWEGSLRVELRPGRGRAWVEAYGRRLEEVAPWPAAPGAIQTFGSLFSGEDYAESYYASGVDLGLEFSGGGTGWGLFGRVEAHDSAWLAAPETFAEGFRPVRAVRSGTAWGGGLWVGSPGPVGFGPLSGLGWSVRGATFVGDFDYTRIVGRIVRGWAWPRPELRVIATLRAGAVFGADIPPQGLVPVGGRGTLRGYLFHEFVGNRYATASVDVSVPLKAPWIRAHAFADVGWADLGGGVGDAVRRWTAEGRVPAGPTRGLRPSVGLGLGVVYDVLRVEAARGLRGGTWEWIVTVHPAFWPWL